MAFHYKRQLAGLRITTLQHHLRITTLRLHTTKHMFFRKLIILRHRLMDMDMEGGTGL